MHSELAHIAYSPTHWQTVVEPPAMTAGHVSVWKADLNLSALEYQRFSLLLSEDEKERASRFRFDKDRVHFVAARGILRSLLSHYLDCDGIDIMFEYNSYGKPLLPKGHALEFNLSHSGGMGLFVFSLNQPLGVDLEVINPAIETAKLAKRFFSKNESAALLSQPIKKQVQLFFNCWTRKEAFIKGHGEGLSLPLDQFEVSLLESEPPQLKATRWNASEVKEWKLYSFEPGIKKTAAVAIKGKVKEIHFLKYDVSKPLNLL